MREPTIDASDRKAPIIVTGASGFVGSAVARALLAAKQRVRVLIRPGSPRDNLTGLDVETIVGDLLDGQAAARAMTGVAGLFHVAADYRLWAPDPQDIVRNNLSMTRNIMEAALAVRVPRIVYTSSVATLRPAIDGERGDETKRLAEGEAIGAYKRSKIVAERLVETLIADRQLPAVIVHPSTPIGPRDIKPTPTGRLVLDAASGRVPAYIDTGLNLVHVDDVAQGHIAAFERGVIGERYILGGEDVELRTMLTDIAEMTGRSAPRFRMPRSLALVIAYGSELAARITGSEPLATVDGVRMAKYRMFYSSEKARRELGYLARPYREALADAIAWYRQTGRLK
jgi:dihydroflavonol-4-reductase